MDQLKHETQESRVKARLDKSDNGRPPTFAVPKPQQPQAKSAQIQGQGQTQMPLNPSSKIVDLPLQ